MDEMDRCKKHCVRRLPAPPRLQGIANQKQPKERILAIELLGRNYGLRASLTVQLSTGVNLVRTPCTRAFLTPWFRPQGGRDGMRGSVGSWVVDEKGKRSKKRKVRAPGKPGEKKGKPNKQTKRYRPKTEGPRYQKQNGTRG